MFRIVKKMALITLLGLLVTPLFSYADTLSLATERPLYQQALTQLKQGNWQQFNRIKSQLTHYPLYPYLDYYAYRRDTGRFTDQQIERFIKRYRNNVVADLMRSQWLRQLAKRQQWRRYVKAYQPTNNSELTCYYRWAQYQSGDRQAALKNTAPLWLLAKSQHKACDPLFSRWLDSAYFNKAIVWQRIQLAIKAGNYSLVNYLRRFISAKEQPQLDLLERLRRDPQLLADPTLFAGQPPIIKATVIQSFKRLARRDPQQAVKLWPRYRKQRGFTAEQRQAIDHYLALALTRSLTSNSQAWIAQIDPQGKDPELVELASEQAIMDQNWPKVIALVAKLPAKQQQTARWQYWLARALTADGKSAAANQRAKQLYAAAARERDYYGFMAAYRGGHAFVLNLHKVDFSRSQLNAFAQKPGIRRAHEFFLLNQLTNANREWRRGTAELDKEQQALAAKVANEWGWYFQAIRLAYASEAHNDLSIRFPLAFADDIEQQAKKENINSRWVFAVARQESAFASNARSSAGALGLMQLLPRTARYVAGRANIPYRGASSLLQPATNVRLGSRYLHELYKRFANNAVLASAAYNAGPGRVLRWLPSQTIPADVWIERIPYNETRNYVQRVLTYWIIYSHQYGGKINLVQILKPVNPTL
jgi:soluble lytic murein transglycosylase